MSRLLPHAAKAWLRGALRRPGRGLVVVTTLVIMTIGVAGALVAADSLERLFIEDARAQWPHTDVAVTPVGNAVFEEGLARMIGVEAGATATRWAPRMVLDAVAEAGAARDPDALVLGVGPEEQSYPPLEALHGSDDPLALSPQEALLNERAARRLDVGVGDDVTVLIAVPEVLQDVPGRETQRRREPETVTAIFQVAGVVANRGVADLHRTPNVITRRDSLQRVTALEGQVTALHLAARVEGEEGGDAVVRAIQPLLRQTGLTSATVAQDALDIADDEGGQFRSILLTLALLVAAAAAVAAIQLLTSLAEDRSREIAILRALGTRPRVIVRLVTAEAVGYAVVAVAVGIVAALPVADAVASRLADHFGALSAGRGREQVALQPFVDPLTLVTGALVVALSAALAGRTAGRRLAAVDTDTLLRGPLVRLPGAPLPSRRPVLVALLGAFLLGVGMSGGAATDALRYLGLTLLGAAWWLRLRRLRPDRRRVDKVAAVAALAWATLGAAALADFSQGYETGFGILTVAGVVSVVAVTALLAVRFRGVMRIVRSYVPQGRWQAALRTAGAAAEAATGRTGRLHATFGIVLFMAAALQVLGSATQIDVTRQSGGFDVIAESVGRLDIPEVTAAPGAAATVPLVATMVGEDRYGVERGDDDNADVVRVRYPVRLVGANAQLVQAQSFGLAEALPGYGSAAAALEAVVTDGDKAVVDRYARPPGAALGDDVVLDIGGVTRTYELIGVLDTFLLGSVFVAESELVDLVSSHGPTFLLARADDGTSAQSLARGLQAAGRGAGLTAETVREVAADVVAVNRTFTDTFALILLLGLAVAVIAVAASLVRSAREQRPYLAVLRALGFRRSTVAIALAAEPVAVASVGAVVGLAVGLAVLRVLFAAGFSDLAFVVDLGRLAAVLAGLVVLLVVVGAVTARPLVPRDISAALRDIA